MPKLINMIGEKFGRLTVLEEVAARLTDGGKQWLCRCSCGNEKVVRGANLRNGNTKSCGCLFIETSSAKMTETLTKHGQSKNRSPAYVTWQAMHQRCRDPERTAYGGRGITVCERWNSFAHFLADMGERPEGMTIDRKDVDGNYEPNNCRWVTPVEQANNKR